MVEGAAAEDCGSSFFQLAAHVPCSEKQLAKGAIQTKSKITFYPQNYPGRQKSCWQNILINMINYSNGASLLSLPVIL